MLVLLYLEMTRLRVDAKLPALYRVGDVTAWCRISSSAAVSNLLEIEFAMEHERVSQLT